MPVKQCPNGKWRIGDGEWTVFVLANTALLVAGIVSQKRKEAIKK